MNKLDGTLVAQAIEQELTLHIKKKNLSLRMDVILVGKHAPSLSYVQRKKAMCDRVGITCYIHEFDASISQEELLEQMDKMNVNPDVTGYIVQLPLPEHISLPAIIEQIDPLKDVDGFTFYNTGHLFHEFPREQYLMPATAAGVLDLLQYYDIPLKGKHVVVVGKGFIVGKPIALAMMAEQATVSVAHEFTEDLATLTQSADILVSATGVKHLISPDMIKDGTVLVDIGFAREGKHIFGDIHPDCYPKSSWYTPNIGGVGPMTVASLLQNVYNAHKLFGGK